MTHFAASVKLTLPFRQSRLLQLHFAKTRNEIQLRSLLHAIANCLIKDYSLYRQIVIGLIMLLLVTGGDAALAITCRHPLG